MSMTCYLIGPGHVAEDAGLCRIEASRACCLPGVRCPVCKATWAATGLAYPSINCPELPDGTEHPIDLAAFRGLSEALRVKLPEGVLLLPGTGFGPLEGTASGEIGGLVWLNPWTLLMRSSLWRAFGGRGIELAAVSTRIAFEGLEDDPLVEIEAPPQAAIHSSCMPEGSVARCKACGRFSFPLPDSVSIARDTFCDKMPFQRVRNFTTLLAASASMKEAVEDIGIRDVLLTEVGLV